MGCTPKNNIRLNPSEIKIISNPTERAENPNTYFKTEYASIACKRKGSEGVAYEQCKEENTKSKNFQKPPRLIGLALSGGGLRSHAFQMGLLHGIDDARKNIDYISSVSGGSWASLSYKTMSDTQWTEIQNKVFKNEINITYLPTSMNLLFKIFDESRRKAWRDLIQEKFLPNLEKSLLSDLENSAKGNYYKKPLVILGATHTAYPQVKPTKYSMIRSFPAELTSEHISSIIDCGSQSTDFCLKRNADEIITNKRENFKGFQINFDGNANEIQISDALAISSAFTKQVTGWDITIEYKSKEIDKSYFFSDGGLSENLGVIPLVERGVDLIIVSDIAYDTDGDAEIEDNKALKTHLKKLFKVDYQFIDDCELEKYLESCSCFFIKGGYSKTPKDKKVILYIKPKKLNRMHNFLDYLEQNYQETYHYLKKNKNFPNDPTYLTLTGHNQKLINAYYLLGKFIGEKLKEEIVYFVGEGNGTINPKSENIYSENTDAPQNLNQLKRK